MKKTIKLSVAATLVSSVILQAASVDIDNQKAGNIDFMLKGMTVLSDTENGFAPSNGSGYLVKLKYETADILTDGLKLGVGMYTNGDAGLSVWDEANNKGAYGMVVDAKGDQKSLMGELYLSYSSKYVNIDAGRQILKTPLTVIDTSLMPNFYEAAMLGSDVVEGLKLTAGHISKMSLGSRAMTDWGLIGEKTGTAGVAPKLFQLGGTVEQAEFYNMGVVAGKASTDGRSLVGATYSGVKNLQADLWFYHSYDIADDIYAEIKYAVPITEGIKLGVNAQYLTQTDTGDALAGTRDFNMMGLKINVGNEKWNAFAAYNQSGDAGQYFNAWGADPAYTSSIFSRNAYRTDVSAYKVGGHYVITKGVKLMVNYANYGKSQTTQANLGTIFGNTDATELDTVLVYKPSKNWMFKLFNAKRISEYDTAANDITQDHYRLIASYTF